MVFLLFAFFRHKGKYPLISFSPQPQTHHFYSIAFIPLPHFDPLLSYDYLSLLLILLLLLLLLLVFVLLFQQKKENREPESNMSSTMQAFLDSTPDPSPPPPGIEANFNAPNTNGTAIIIVAVIGVFLATVFTAVRIYTKGIMTRSLGWDDCKNPLFSSSSSSSSSSFLPKEAEGMGRGRELRLLWERGRDII